MTKQEYQKLRAKCQIQIKIIEAELLSLREQYINANAKYRIGDKVAVFNYWDELVGLGFISEIDVSYGHISYSVSKSVDGKPSSENFVLLPTYKIV